MGKNPTKKRKIAKKRQMLDKVCFVWYNCITTKGNRAFAFFARLINKTNKKAGVGMTFSAFFDMVKNAEFGLDSTINGINNFIAGVLESTHVAVLRDYLATHLSAVLPYIPYVLLAIYAVVLFGGKRLFPFLRFLVFFGVGFVLGVYYLSPLVLVPLPTLPTWVIGLVAGIVASVMAKLLYWLVIIAVVGYGAYMFCFTGTLIPALTVYTQGNYLVSLAVAAVLVILVFILLKYIEMIGTAMLGGFGIATFIRTLYDYTTISVFVGREWLGVLVVTVVIALIGFTVQFKHRETFR